MASLELVRRITLCKEGEWYNNAGASGARSAPVVLIAAIDWMFSTCASKAPLASR